MKKISILAFALLNCVILSVPLYAQPLAFFKPNNHSNNNFTLFTLNVSTSNGQPVTGLIAEHDYAGNSRSAPCSDLRLLFNGSGETRLDPGLYPFNAEDFKYYPGPGFTCFKMDFIILGKFYSTGNIQLNWNQGGRSYTDANPRMIPLAVEL